MFEFLKLAASAFLGMIVGLAIQWIKSSRDELKATCDELCHVIGDASDLASDYWLRDGSADQIKLIEARLLGFQTRLVGLKVLVEGQFDETDLNQVESALADLFDSCTGGGFQVTGRSVDADRCRQAQIDASVAMVAIRKAYKNAVAIRSLSKRSAARSKAAFAFASVHLQRTRAALERLWQEKRPGHH